MPQLACNRPQIVEVCLSSKVSRHMSQYLSVRRSNKSNSSKKATFSQSMDDYAHGTAVQI